MEDKETRLKQLSEKRFLSIDEAQEKDRLEAEITENKTGMSFSQYLEKKKELESLISENKELEIAYRLKREREKREILKNKLDGKVFCDDCKKWVYPSHFD